MTDPLEGPAEGPADTLRTSYDAVAAEYVAHLYEELRQKPLDRHLLHRFAEEVKERGPAGAPTADLGCGPGHVARYLTDLGLRTLGIDLSPGMIEQASRLNPEMDFRVGDLRALDLADGSLAGIVAFYSLIHLEPQEMAQACREFHRVLAPGGLALVAFHVGTETLHVDELWGQAVSLDFRFLEPRAVAAALEEAGLVVRESTEREPYEGVEYPSRRCYLLARRG